MGRKAPDIRVAKAGQTLVDRVGRFFLRHAFTQVHPPLVDRRADDPIADIVSLTVIGPDVLEADRFATAAFAMGKDGIYFIEQTLGLEGYVVDINGGTLHKIVPAGVTLVITTLAIVVRSKGEVDQSYDISMKAAREMAAAGVDIVVLGGVPINLSKGYSNAEQMIIDLEAELKVKVSTSASAQAKAAKALGCKKVVVAQPYELSETDRIASYGTHFGCEVLGATGWGSAFNQIGRIPRNAAIEMGRKLMREHPDADSILLPSPHWPTAEAIDVLEREFGVNVMTAHQAIVWDALRRCGVNDRIAGFGRLFRDF